MTEHQEILHDNLEYTLFSWSKQGGLNPLNIKSAKGVFLYDYEGRKIHDFSSQLMNVNIGHGHPKVAEAVYEQMKQIAYVHPGMATKIRGDLGKKLASIAPKGMTKTLFTLGGSESVENAIKLARIYTGRHKIIAQYRSYHGATYGAISVSGDPRRFPVDSQGLTNIVRVENPYFYRCPWYSETIEECGERAAANLEMVVRLENPDSVAAILMEGESGSSGCMKYPPFYLKKVREICDKYGILLIDDEVMSGFGRTGKMFAIEHHEVSPDILCMAKGLTSGYLPLGGILISDKIAHYFDDKYLQLGLTYSAHATSCAAALAVINIYEEEKLLDNCVKMGAYMDAKVEKLKEKHASIGDYRNTGLFGVIELVKNRKTKEPLAPWNAPANLLEPTNRIAAKIRELGMYTFVRWNMIFMAPPLCINEAEMDDAIEIISKAIDIADEYYKE